MTIQNAYDAWSGSYDTCENRTRDLEKQAALAMAAPLASGDVLELGCGTGKNTVWLAEKANTLTGLDFSEKMLRHAREKVVSGNVTFHRTDLNRPWPVPDAAFDLVTCSLTLEHIADLVPVFARAHDTLRSGGRMYICELHPFRQYLGSKAKYEDGDAIVALEVFVHHISDYLSAANAAGFRLLELREWFDPDGVNPVPRLAAFVFGK